MRKSRVEKEREKIVQDRLQVLITQMLKDEDNKYCVDCDSKGTVQAVENDMRRHNLDSFQVLAGRLGTWGSSSASAAPGSTATSAST